MTSTTHKTLRGPRGGIILMGKDFGNPWGLTTPKGAVKMMSQILNSAPMNTKKPKVRLWSVLTALTAILTIAAIVGNMIANQYATTLNVALNASTYKLSLIHISKAKQQAADPSTQWADHESVWETKLLKQDVLVKKNRSKIRAEPL